MNLLPTPLSTSAWILSEATMERLGWVLVHSLWQFLLLAILAQVVLRLSKRSSASLRYAILVFTMAACVVLPVLTWFSLPTTPVPVATDALNDTIEPSPIESMQSPQRSSNEVAILSDEREDAAELPSIINRPAVESTHSVAESIDWWMNSRDSLRPWLTSIVTVWILGVMICAMRPLLSWIAIRRWRRFGTTPVGKEATELMLRLMERLRIGRTVEILQSTLVHVPLVVGYVRPMILLPASLLSNLPTSQLEAIIAHELAHVRRHDFLVNFTQTIIETLFFYHPAIWWLSHRIRIERENCCDDLVVQTLGNRVEYGRALVAVEQLRADSNVLALGVSDGSMLARIRRIAGQTGNGHNSSSWSLVSLLASSLPVVVIIGLVSWHSLAATPAQTATELVSDGSILDGSFRDEVNLKLTRNDAHQGRWYFVDLDQGELKTPPFEVDIDATRFPYFVNKPSEEELSDWLKHDGVDLILRNSIYRPDPKGPIEKNEIQVRSVRTLLKELPRALQKTETASPTWQQSLEKDVLDAFGAKDDAVHVVGFIPNTTAFDIRPDSPLLRSFRTASNLLGVFLLEQPNSNDDELGLRIAYATNKDTPLDDLRFGPDDYVSGIESLEHPVVRKNSEASFVAKFPNDVRVEFVGLSRGVGDIKAADKWWRPDGTPLQHAPEHRGASGVLQDGELESEAPYVRTVIHAHGISDNNAVTATAAIESAESLKDKSGGLYVTHHGYADAPGRTRTFEVGVATEAPSPKRWLDRDGKRIESKTVSGIAPDKDLIAEDITIEKVGPESWGKRVTNTKSPSKGGLKDPVEPGDKKMGSLSGTTQVTIRFPLPWRNVDLRLFAIDKSGNSHAADTTITLDPNDENADYKRLAKVIPVDYSEVDHFVYQFRVYRHWAIFENVSLWKGTQTEVVMKSETIPTTSRAATSADSAKHSAVGVLPNGDTVELIHLATAARWGITGKRVWWKPDGTLDEETNATEIEPEMIRRIANDRRLFEIHMSSTNPQPSIHLKTIPPMRLENSAYVDFTKENGKPARSLSGQFGPVGNEKQITLKVGVTSEPWGEWQDVGLAGEPLNPFDAKQNYADFYRMIKVVSAGQLLVTMLPPPEKVPLLSEKAVSNEKPDANWVSTVATIQWPENHDDVFAFEFRAVGTDGATNYANGSTGTDSSGKTQFFFNGDVLREKLTKYQYRLRPYRHWVTFEDVANQAGVQTNVKVNVEAVVSPKVSSSTITKDDIEKTALEASIPPVPAEAPTVRLEVKGKDANGKTVVLMSFEELQREEATSTVRTTYTGGGSVGSSLFIVRGACEIAKARGAVYFAKLKEWRGDDGTWMYLFGFSKHKDIRPLTNENELKIFAVSEYEFLFNDPADANIDVVPNDQYVKSGVPMDDLTGEGVMWSEVQNGLSLGYRITGDEWRILGKEVKVELWVLNPAYKDVKFQLNMRPDLGLRLKLKDAKGEVHDSNIWPNDGPPLAENCLLPPGHAIKVKEFTVSLLWPFNDVSRVQGHFFAINPGAYNFQCELELPGFSAAGEGGKQLTPAAGEWTGKLTTRGSSVEVIAPDAPAPKPRIESVVVRISKDGELSLDRKKMAPDEMKTRAARNAKKWFTIEADDDVPYAKVIEIVEVLKAVGVTNFSFAEARVGDGKYRVANRTGSYKLDGKRRFSICQPFERMQWFTVAWPANDGQPAKSLKLYPNASEQTRGSWAVVWEPGTDVLWWVDDSDIGKMTLTDPARVIVERKGRKTSFSRDFALPDGVANEFRRLGFDIGGKPGEPLVIGGPTSRQEILSAEEAAKQEIPTQQLSSAIVAALQSAPMIEHNSGAEIEKTVLAILRTPFIDDPDKGTWQLGAHDIDVHWKLRDIPQRTEVIITLFKVIDRTVPSTMHERLLAMEFLGGADPRNLVPRLNKELEDAIADPAKPFAAYHEIEILGRMGEHSRSSVPLLVKLLDSKDRVAYDAAVNALIIIGARTPDVMNELAKHTDDPVTVYQLGRYGQSAWPLGPVFVKLLDSPSKEIHSYAASALVRTGFDEARGLNVLIADVSDGKSEDRCRAATSLAALGSQAASMIPKLRSFENDPDAQVAKSVREAIVRIEKDDRIFTHAEEATKREASQEASAALNPQMQFALRMLGGDEQTPLAGIEIVATEGYGASQKKFGPFLTDASGTALCKLPQGFYSLHLNSKNELPYLPYEKFWKELPPPGFKWLDLRVTGIGVEKWLGGEIRESGVEHAKSSQELTRITFTLLKPIELILRAVDKDTGQGLPGAYFYLESAAAEDWAHPIDGANIGANQYRDGVNKYESNDYKTDADGYFKRFVSDGYLRRSGDSEWGPKFGVWKSPEGYEVVDPKGEVAIDFPADNRPSVERIFHFRRVK